MQQHLDILICKTVLSVPWLTNTRYQGILCQILMQMRKVLYALKIQKRTGSITKIFLGTITSRLLVVARRYAKNSF